VSGLGQMYLGNYTRGVVILISAIVLAALAAFLNLLVAIPSIMFWIWQIIDAGREYNKRRYLLVEITCRNCGWNNSSHSEFCTKCGNRIQNICTICNNLNKIDVSNCGKCGEKL
jgi:hypothetical protein